MKKRLLSGLLALALVLGMVPASLVSSVSAATTVRVNKLSLVYQPVQNDGNGITAGQKLPSGTFTLTPDEATDTTGKVDHTGNLTYMGIAVGKVTYAGTDSNLYWAANQTPRITIAFTTFTKNNDYTFTVGSGSKVTKNDGSTVTNTGTTRLTVNGLDGDWDYTVSANSITLTLASSQTNAGKVQSTYNETTNVTTYTNRLQYLPNSQTVRYTTDGTWNNQQESGPLTSGQLTLYVAKGQSITLNLTSQDENGRKGGTFSIVSGSVPTQVFTVTGGGTGTFTIRGGNYAASGVSFVINVAKTTNCDAQTFTINVEVVDSSAVKFAPGTPTTKEYQVDANKDEVDLTVNVTDSSGTALSNQTVEFKSSDTAVLSFDGAAVVDNSDGSYTVSPTMKGVGTVTVTAEVKGTKGELLGTATHKLTITPFKVVPPTFTEESFQYDLNPHTYQWTTTAGYTKDQTGTKAELSGIALYEVTENQAVSAGTHKVLVKLLDKVNTVWSTTGNNGDITQNFTIAPRPITTMGITVINPASIIYDGTNTANMTKQIETGLQVKDSGNVTLVLGVDYTISYDNLYAGTHKVTITGIGNYSGTRTDGEFTVTAGQIELDSKSPAAGPTLITTVGTAVDMSPVVTVQDESGNERTDVTLSKLKDLKYVLTDADITAKKGTVSGSRFTASSTLGVATDDTRVTVNCSASGYDANGDGVLEYEMTSTAPIQIGVKVMAANQVAKVTIPTGKTLTYTGAAQQGIPLSEDYAIKNGGNDRGDFNSIYGISDDTCNLNNWDTSDDYFSATVVLNPRTDGKTPIWSDGTTGNKQIKWQVLPLEVKGVPTVESVVIGDETLNNVDISAQITSGGTNHKDYTFVSAADGVTQVPGKVYWNYNFDRDTKQNAANTLENIYVVQGQAYEWIFIPDRPNYKYTTGTAVPWGGSASQDQGKDDGKTETKTSSSTSSSSVSNINGSVSTTNTTTTTTTTYKDGVPTNSTSTTASTVTTTSSDGLQKVVSSYNNGVLSGTTATNNAGVPVMTYVPTTGITWGTVALVNGRADNGSLPVNSLGAMYVELPAGTSSISMANRAINFTDLGSGNWAYPGVQFASARGYVQGVSTTSNVYSPNSYLKRGQIFTMLARHSGDVTLAQSTGANWHVAGANWVKAKGVSDGTRYQAEASREETILMMYNYYSAVKGTPSVNLSGLNSYTDSNKIGSDAARNAMAWALQVGILKGYPGGALNPGSSIQRDEAATLITRLSYVMEGVTIPSEI